MDKKGARILFGCLVGTVMVVLLFFLASRLTQQNCELIIIDEAQLRSSSLANWPKEKPIRSHDKTTLFTISAYLEYNIQPSLNQVNAQNASQINNHSSQLEQDLAQQTAQQQQQQQANQQQQQPQPQQQQQQQPSNQQQQSQPAQQQQQQPHAPLAANPIGQQTAASGLNQAMQVPAQSSTQQLAVIEAGKHPTPSVPQFTSQQIANSSAPFNFTSSLKAEKPRFLPIQLEDIEMKPLENNRYQYKLNFNCSTMKVILVRNQDRVYIEKIKMDLKPKSRQKSDCELRLPTQGIFSAPVSNGWARYYCDAPVKYGCYHTSSKHPGPGILLAELHINGIEFETNGANSSSIHKTRDFLGTRKLC